MNPLDFVKLTPKTNCGECDHPTCLAFAVAVTKGGADALSCPYVDPDVLPDALKTKKVGSAGLDEVGRGQYKRDMALVAHLKSKVRHADFEKVAPLLGAERAPGLIGGLTFMYLGKKIELDKNSLNMDGAALVDPRDQILLYNYVAYGGGEKPAFDWVGLESLPNSISKVRTLSTYCEQPLAKRFDGRAKDLENLSRQLGSFAVQGEQSADVAVVIPVLPHVPLCLLFWDSDQDDGFSSRVKILFDRQVLNFLDIESLVFCAERLAECLMELES